MVNRGVFDAVGRQIGVGKESVIFEVATKDGTILVMKLHRLGRTSIWAVKLKRDYLRHRSSYSWLYLSRSAALREFAFMKALDEHGFPVPHAVDCNRHCVIMSRIQGYPLSNNFKTRNTVFETILGLIVRLADHGLIHCDFNEFNIMVDDDEKVTMIDFPQRVSVSHRNEEMYFDRDIECIFKFFGKRFNLSFNETEVTNADSEEESNEGFRPLFSDIKNVSGYLDKELEASGFTRKDQDDIEKFIAVDAEKDSSSDSEGIDDGDTIKGTSGESLSNFGSLCLVGKGGDLKLDCSQDTCKENSQIGHEPREDGLAEPANDTRVETQAGSDSGSEEENDSKNPELINV